MENQTVINCGFICSNKPIETNERLLIIPYVGKDVKEVIDKIKLCAEFSSYVQNFGNPYVYDIDKQTPNEASISDEPFFYKLEMEYNGMKIINSINCVPFNKALRFLNDQIENLKNISED